MPRTIPAARHNGFASSLAPLILILVAGASAGAEPPAARPTPFTTVVEENFAAWDRDADRILEPTELDSLVADPNLHGKAAAAAGVLKAFQRSGKVTLPPLTIDYFHLYEQAVAEHAPLSPDFDRAFIRASRRIATPRRDLLTGEEPTLDTCHQGPLGDCYFVSVVGAAVARDPASVRSMIQVTGDGQFEVTFGDGRRITVPPLTDAELALTSTAGRAGLWLPVLEKAYGTIRTEALPEEKQSESTTDAIAHGGSAATTIRLITGHKADRIALRPKPPSRGSDKADANADSAAPAAAPAADPDPVAAEAAVRRLQSVLNKVRPRLIAAVNGHQLVAAGTPAEGDMPPGINARHAYAVLGYDQAADTIQLWNPHGNTFKPRGEPGLDHGYPTRAGRFTMSLTEFAQVFQGIVFERSVAQAESAIKPEAH